MGETIQTANELTSFIETKGLLGVCVLLCLVIVGLVIFFYRKRETRFVKMETQINELQLKVDNLQVKIMDNKDRYSEKLEKMVSEMKVSMDTNNRVIEQNSEIIKNFIQWREK